MRLILLVITFCVSIQTVRAQLTPPASTVLEDKQPLRYGGYLDVNGLLPLKFVPSPNDLAFDVKYWFSKEPTMQSGFGFGWQIGFNEGYAKSTSNLLVDGLVGNELAYLYNYLSLRYKFMKGTKKIRPYAEIGGGWLLVANQFVDRPANPDYDPDHSCPDGPSEYLRNGRAIRTQNKVAVDVELGLNFYLTDEISLNVGIGSIFTNKVAQLEEAYDPATLESVMAQSTSYQFRNNFLQAPSIKIGVSFLLFCDPNQEEEKEKDCCSECHNQTIASSYYGSNRSCRYK